LTGRWSDYFIKHGAQFEEFWKELLGLKNRHVVFILGHGFDPRMCQAIRVIMGTGGDGLRDCIALTYDEGSDSPSYKYKKLIKDNWDTLTDLINETRRGNISTRNIKTWSPDKRRITSLSAARTFNSLDELSRYSDIMIDISAMPRTIYFPLIHKILILIDTMKASGKDVITPNLHVVVSEDYMLDSRIHEEEIEDTANYLHGFGAIDLEANEGMPKVWIPILGEGKEIQLIKIQDFVKPGEVCPLLPFPSQNPRRGDDLLREYRRFLFDTISIEPRNIIYADEQNPFQVYRQIKKTIDHYNQSLAILGGCKIIISALSSKLLSIGALLSAYEAKGESILVGIANVESNGYRIDEEESLQDNRSAELFELWLAGDCYEP
jgi:hypothetical protein